MAKRLNPKWFPDYSKKSVVDEIHGRTGLLRGIQAAIPIARIVRRGSCSHGCSSWNSGDSRCGRKR